jgi:hypothetical protein
MDTSLVVLRTETPETDNALPALVIKMGKGAVVVLTHMPAYWSAIRAHKRVVSAKSRPR